MKQPIAIIALLAAALMALALILCWPSGNMASRDIGCANVNSERGRDVCNALSASMEWTWMGHAIVSPGWRVTWSGLARVYCRENLTTADLPVLEVLKRGSDLRLADGAEDLIRLTTNTTGKVTESETSIFNPKNPDYILRNGCIH